ncbi:hypothetical protein [Halostagnicola sp. A56]|uniref:hypothetical protein n=1 Tax=Halostagnicola sp. A56 TaxID=1495067 RepID=UPI0012E185DC|nr:hypothetical protein [Halostagnicola sp. A56]
MTNLTIFFRKVIGVALFFVIGAIGAQIESALGPFSIIIDILFGYTMLFLMFLIPLIVVGKIGEMA